MLENKIDPNQLSRIELLALAQTLRVPDADVMTRAELRSAIEKARRPEPRPPAQPVTWVSVARRLLASIVEQGLNLPDAAALIRGDTKLNTPPSTPPPVATVTLARIYAAQGHVERAIGTLDEVLASDPDHDLARELRAQLSVRLSDSPPRNVGPEDSQLPERSVAAEDSQLPERSVATEDSRVPENFMAAEDSRVPENFMAAVDSVSAVQAPLMATPTPVEHAESTDGPIPPADADSSPQRGTPVSQSTVVPQSERAPPRPPQLLVIETDTPTAYVYWELSDSNNTRNDPHWICVVTHTPSLAGCERQERRFPVHRGSGAVRLEGVPPGAVLRAALAHENSPSLKPLVVASSVRTREPPSPDRLEAGFMPHAKANPIALARRAINQVESASAVHW